MSLCKIRPRLPNKCDRHVAAGRISSNSRGRTSTSSGRSARTRVVPEIQGSPVRLMSLFRRGSSSSGEIELNPLLWVQELREDRARDALLYLTRYLDAACEGFLTQDRERGHAHAERFIPLVSAPEKDDGADVVTFRIRWMMGDATVHVAEKVAADFGGLPVSGTLGRGLLLDSLGLLVENGGRFAPGGSCGIHPSKSAT